MRDVLYKIEWGRRHLEQNWVHFGKILLSDLYRKGIKNDRNGGIWQSGISKSLAEYVQRPVWFDNVQSSLHENVVFSVGVRMGNATYIIFIMWSSISG